MEEHGVELNHATLNWWVIKYVPLLEREFRTCKHPAGPSWRMDETYVRVKGTWKYPDRPGRQGRRHRGFPADRQARSQSRVAILAQGDQV
jgi:hypothetical protein